MRIINLKKALEDKMKQNENNELKKLTLENFANLFNVYIKDKKFIYSINKGLYFKNIDNYAPNNIQIYEIQNGDQWTNISYKFYGTIELWWIICKINGITDPVRYSPIEGNKIIILNKELINNFLQYIKGA
jgi:hypothetical protein